MAPVSAALGTAALCFQLLVQLSVSLHIKWLD